MPSISNSNCIRIFPVIFLCVIIFGGSAFLVYGQLLTDSSNISPTTQTDRVNGQANSSKLNKWEALYEIEKLREYLRIPSVHPDIDYEPCVEFLKNQAENLGLETNVYYPVDVDNPVVVMTWQGSQPELPTIMLNSHMDVVPVYEEFWTHPPFAAEMDENGNIFARGAQDMKQVGMQYLAAIRALKRSGIKQLKRTVHIVFVPDEEVGLRGMHGFVRTDEFKAMNVTFVLDEGGVAQNDEGILPVYYAERTIWQIEFIFHGQSGHGSLLLDNNAAEKLSYVVNKFSQFRKNETRKLKELKYPYGNVTTINLTQLKGGIEINVIPSHMTATYDIRISINMDLTGFEKQINRWCEEAGGNITINYLIKRDKEKATLVDSSNPFWMAFKQATIDAGIKVEPMVLGATSDMIHIRRLDISALGFSPLINTIPKLHDHNEYINTEVYIAGIAIYEKIIFNLGDV